MGGCVGVPTAPAEALPRAGHPADFVNRLLDVVEHEIAPKTSNAVLDGNKLFGAAVIRKADLSVVAADTNREMDWPLLHGEVSCLRTLNSMPVEERPWPKDCYFIATHEPCSLCLSAITWSGFDNFYYLFSYEDTKHAFKIPHDLKILKEVFNCDRGKYNRKNEFWTAHSISDLIDKLSTDAKKKCRLRMEALRQKYNGMSLVYQQHKSCNHGHIPLS
mmetsp:Transcript_40429/g.114486  ORF Transcript_40429/g.114486 Transcript_40429/m.114486 type:complete len:218 (+) Transcript_40429:171-824(+)